MILMSKYTSEKENKMFPQIMNHSEWKDRLVGKVSNIENLPGGLRCKFLVLIQGQNGTLIAKQWKRKIPQLKSNEYLIFW